MHGRPRQKGGPPDPERVKAAQKKAALFGQLSQEVLERRAARRYDPDSLALAGKLLELHPEVYTVWNYRREALQPVLEAGGEPAVSAVAAELALTERALRKNPKSYATWHHRRWLVVKGFCSLERELQLVNQLLDADERNFHGWGYRRFVVQLMGTPAARELEYAELKIEQNFSNYSAWHSRTVLLPLLHGASAELEAGAEAGDAAAAAAAAAAKALSEAVAAAKVEDPAGDEAGGGEAAAEASEAAAAAAAGGGPEQQQQQGQQRAEEQQRARPPPPGASSASAAVPLDALDAEYDLVKQAFFTEPEDQAGWFYHRWLLGCSLAHWERARGTGREAQEQAALLAVLAREQQTCQELLELEPDAKWPLLTLTRLRELQVQVQQASGAGIASLAAADVAEGCARLAADVAEGYAWLLGLDAMRRGYYEDARDGRAHVVAKPAAAR